MVAFLLLSVRGDYVGVVSLKGAGPKFRAHFAHDYLLQHHPIEDPGSATGTLDYHYYTDTV